MTFILLTPINDIRPDKLKNLVQEIRNNISDTCKGISTNQLWWKYNLTIMNTPECSLLEIPLSLKNFIRIFFDIIKNIFIQILVAIFKMDEYIL